MWLFVLSVIPFIVALLLFIDQDRVKRVVASLLQT